MYHNRSLYASLKYKLGYRGLLSIFCLLVIVILASTYYVYWSGNRLAEDESIDTKNLIARYTGAIKTYLINDQKNFTQKHLEANVRSFKFTNELFVQYRWQEDAEHFNNMCNEAFVVLFALLKPNYYRSKELWNVIIHCVTTVCSKFNTSNTKSGFPWGQNWYVFSITFPRLLVFSTYMYRSQFGKPHANLEAWLKIIIPYLIQSPTVSLKYPRDGPNAIMMAVPWLGAQILLNSYNRKKSDPGYKYVIGLLNTGYVHSGEGYYPDGGFITHTCLRGYGYLDNCLEDVRLLTTIINPQFTLITKMLRIRRLLDNASPKVMHQMGLLHTRTGSMLQRTAVYGSYGHDIIPSMRIVSVKQPNYILQFFGQHLQYYYYEADRIYRQWLMYSVMAREYLYEDSDSRLRLELITYYPGVISIDNRQVIAEVDEAHTTTQGYLPTEAMSIICKINDTCVALYNRYFIDVLNHPVEELMLVHDDAYTVSYTIPSDNENLVASLVLSINLGQKYNELTNTTHDDNIEETGKSMSSSIYRFKNNNSWVHTNQSVVLKEVKREEDELALQSLQCYFKSSTGAASKTIAYTTFHGKMPPVVQSVGRGYILTDRYKLYYHDNYLYLIDTLENRGTIAQHREEIPAILEIPSMRVKNNFGANAQMENLGKYQPGNNPKFVDINDHSRLHTSFRDVTSKTDAEIRTLVKSGYAAE